MGAGCKWPEAGSGLPPPKMHPKAKAPQAQVLRGISPRPPPPPPAHLPAAPPPPRARRLGKVTARADTPQVPPAAPAGVPLSPGARPQRARRGAPPRRWGRAGGRGDSWGGGPDLPARSMGRGSGGAEPGRRRPPPAPLPLPGAAIKGPRPHGRSAPARRPPWPLGPCCCCYCCCRRRCSGAAPRAPRPPGEPAAPGPAPARPHPAPALTTPPGPLRVPSAGPRDTRTGLSPASSAACGRARGCSGCCRAWWGSAGEGQRDGGGPATALPNSRLILTWGGEQRAGHREQHSLDQLCGGPPLPAVVGRAHPAGLVSTSPIPHPPSPAP